MRCPGFTSMSCGSSCRHLSIACVHLGWNLQPGMWLYGFGGSPGSPCISRLIWTLGIDASSPRVYGCLGSL